MLHDEASGFEITLKDGEVLTEERLGHRHPYPASRKSHCAEMSIQLESCNSGFLATGTNTVQPPDKKFT